MLQVSKKQEGAAKARLAKPGPPAPQPANCDPEIRGKCDSELQCRLLLGALLLCERLFSSEDQERFPNWVGQEDRRASLTKKPKQTNLCRSGAGRLRRFDGRTAYQVLVKFWLQAREHFLTPSASSCFHKIHKSSLHKPC